MTVDYEDKAKQREIRHIFCDMNLCGCGTGRQYHAVAAVLECVSIGGKLYESVGGYSDDYVEFMLHVMNSSKWGLLEHGSSVYGSRLTEKGKVLAQFFRDFGVKDRAIEWPGWWCTADSTEEW